MNILSFIPRALSGRVLLGLPIVLLLVSTGNADEPRCQGDSWIFRRSQFSHDPESGARVAQYTMKPAIEPLPDVRQITSGYSRSRSVLRGTDGSAETNYRVQSYSNGRGGMDAEWERFHDAWRGATVGGGQYGVGGYSGYGWGFGGYGRPPGQGAVPGYGIDPGYGGRYGHQQRPNFEHPGYRGPDTRRLDPDAADGFSIRDRQRSDREFFWQPRDRYPHSHPPTDGHPPDGGEGNGKRQ